jgi:hypothetical protein
MFWTFEHRAIAFCEIPKLSMGKAHTAKLMDVSLTISDYDIRLGYEWSKRYLV